MLVKACDKSLIKSAFLRGKCRHFLIVEWDAKLFRNHSADLLTVRAVLTRDRDNNAGMRRLEYGIGDMLYYGLLFFFEESKTEGKAHGSGDGFGDGKGQPKPIKPDLRKEISERHEQRHRANDGQKRAFHAPADRLEEHGENERGYKRNETESDPPKANYTNRNNKLIRGKDAEHLLWYNCKTKCAKEHQGKSEPHRHRKRFFTAVYISRCVVVADDGNDAGLHSTERNEEECLPLVVKTECCDRLVAEGGENHIQSENIQGVRRLHQHIGKPRGEHPAHKVLVFRELWRLAESLFHNNERRHHLSRNRCDCRARNTQPRESKHTENKKRVKDNIDNRADDLRRHRRFHIALGLQHLRPYAFKEESEAENADDSAV